MLQSRLFTPLSLVIFLPRFPQYPLSLGYRKCAGNIKVFVIYVTAVGKQGSGARTVREKVSVCERDGRGEGMTEMTKLHFNFKK